ncbi:MAG: ABC transporter ATP-binding protein [Gammaproteobacteria bacterium]|jgi:branched-chain amino acid transport system ATP-binding protein|nr:ABC transporter ATP-binding protein [Gammaproteobacteria bacterium]MCP4879283.1 ABC transporter ATP-binding protein [Gammaproteobacteria bacterium]MDP6165099.1 ABC transporter ATP-binding protein [Gammaproteobacteria bacterium]
MLLTLNDVHVHYNKIAALQGISVDVEEGGFVTLIGSNGAGKSTTLRTIVGLETPTKGEIRFESQLLNGMGPDKIVKMGIALVPEGRRVFKDLSILENLQLGAFTRDDSAAVAQDLQKIYGYFPRLRERRHQLARTLSGGEQQMLAIGRALMSKPRLLLLDEPSLGLAPIVVQEIASILMDINKTGVTVILVEQNADLALELAKQGYVLETGRIALAGEAHKLATDEHVKTAYLGL